MYRVLIKLYFAIATILLSCNQAKYDRIESLIINDTFLKIVDTFAYSYTVLRPPPPPYDSPFKRQEIVNEIHLTIYHKLINIYEWDKDIHSVLISENMETINKKEFLTLFESSKKDTSSVLLNIKEIKDVGKFVPSITDDRSFMKKSGFFGHIRFSRVINNDHIGLMVVSIQDNIKSGVEKLVLLEKKNKQWVILKEIEMTIW